MINSSNFKIIEEAVVLWEILKKLVHQLSAGSDHDPAATNSLELLVSRPTNSLALWGHRASDGPSHLAIPLLAISPVGDPRVLPTTTHHPYTPIQPLFTQWNQLLKFN